MDILLSTSHEDLKHMVCSRALLLEVYLLRFFEQILKFHSSNLYFLQTITVL